MRIVTLNESVKKDILGSLLKRSPNQYTEYEATVNEIVAAVREKGDEAVFDYTKLKWMNGEYIKKMDFDEYYERALPYIEKTVTRDIDKKKLAEICKTRIEVFPDICGLIDFLEELPEYDVEMYTHKKMKTNAETSLSVLKELLPVLEAQEDYSNDALYRLLTEQVEKMGVKNGYVLWPVRTAVSGKQMTPAGATEIMELLGKEESVTRIKKGIEKLEAAFA